MKRFFLIMTLALLTGGIVFAQNPRRGNGNEKMDPKERAERMTERIVKEYSLNDAQKQQLLEASKAYMEKMGDMPMQRGDKDADKSKADARREEMKTAREAYDAQIQKILTKEQYADYKSKRDNSRRGQR